MKIKSIRSIVLIIALGLILIISCKQKNSKYLLKPHFPSTESDYYQADSLSGHFHTINAIRDFKWAEHPQEKIIMQTNNLGLRNDSDTKVKKDHNKFRVIITGDSHIDGVVHNHESVAFVLEDGLNKINPSQKYEVLNAGNGYFGPQNYLGVYQKFKPFNPDIFIVIIYTGNDFLDAIRIEAENGRLNVPERPAGYYDKLWEIDGLYSGFTGQQLNQLKFFDTFPSYVDTALQITEQSLLNINKQCKKNEITFLVVLLPTKIVTEPQTDINRINEVFKKMDFNQSHLQKNRQMVLSLVSWLETNDISFIDLNEAFKKSDEELFWKADYHINIAGHRKIAEEIISLGITN